MAISGKPSDICEQALLLANGNADLAFTILTDGIQGMQQPGGPQAMYDDDEGADDPGQMDLSAGPFAALTQHPDFGAIVERIR